ncbi:hypothetical protein FHG87_022719 [Trinorchestia longiramus]|nr:hypothetical protein FHG87_022719 [Trinorchestia longiramus]
MCSLSAVNNTGMCSLSAVNNTDLCSGSAVNNTGLWSGSAVNNTDLCSVPVVNNTGLYSGSAVNNTCVFWPIFLVLEAPLSAVLHQLLKSVGKSEDIWAWQRVPLTAVEQRLNVFTTRACVKWEETTGATQGESPCTPPTLSLVDTSMRFSK